MSHAATLCLGAQPQPSSHSAPASSRWPAAAIAIAAIVSTIFVAMDQAPSGKSPAEILASLAALATLKEWVHGVAIAATCAYAFGFSALAARLGVRGPLVLAGLVAYVAGCGALIGATLFDGFITPHVALNAAGAAPERLAFAYQLVHQLGIFVNDFAKLGWALQAVGALAFALALCRDARMTGLLGVASGMLMLCALALSPTFMSMTAILALLLSQMVWNLAASAYLWRR
jgi:hypothetical protein